MSHILRILLCCLCAASTAYVKAQPIDKADKNPADLMIMPAESQVMPTDEAPPLSVSELFAHYRNGVYQIRVVNQATGQKTSIGSGFVVGDGSLLATNYHVVSDAVQKGNHVLQYVDDSDHEGALELLGVDVIHDLAVVKAHKKLGEPFAFAPVPAQGSPLYALGNPHDLGFVIIDGINNGILKKSAQARILFSGSLNSGMSGGPTLNRDGKVVGVNVAYLRRGNDISFIIPAEYLQRLIAEVGNKPQDINASIAKQLFEDNQAYFDPVLKHDWKTTVIGDYVVPLEMRKDVRCWDSSPDLDVDDLFGQESVTCFNDRSTFISNDVSLGQVGYVYSYFSAREPMLALRFYRLYSKRYDLSLPRRPRRDYDDVSCDANFVRIADRTFKVTLCQQQSKLFVYHKEPITDLSFVAAETGPLQHGLMIEMVIYGVQERLGKEVMAHLLKQIHLEDK